MIGKWDFSARTENANAARFHRNDNESLVNYGPILQLINGKILEFCYIIKS